MKQAFNTRILVIDDEENVRDGFRKILQPRGFKRELESQLELAGAALFDSDQELKARHRQRSSATFDFEFDEATNGKQGFEMVKAAIEEERPYAAVFVDMRMPGWDGLETVTHIRQVDKRCEVIFVTAYSDYSIKEIVTSAGTNISYHCKPFSVEEIEQIATKAVYEWNKTKSLEDLIKTISKLRAQQWQMDPLLKNILQQVSYLLGTNSAMIALEDKGECKVLLAIGNLCDDSVASCYLKDIVRYPEEEMFYNDQCAYFRLNQYGILAVFEKGGKPLNKEKTYLVRLFLEQAVQAINNVDLQEKILKHEQLSAVGEATGMIIHDLKNSIGAIGTVIDMIKEHIEDREAVLPLLDIIKEAAGNGMALAQDILDYTSNKQVRKSPVNGAELLEAVSEKIKFIYKENNVELEFDCPGEIVFSGDFGKLSRVLLNLLNNAIESYKNKNISSPQITVSLSQKDSTVTIIVSDNGPGIPEQIVNDIFKPFATFGKSGGTGLGLAITKQIIDAHGGNIKVQTSPAGTEFTIVIPDK
jgi:signal transduction histidine kinase/DNA-binding response OmpR family regulator